MLFTSLVADLNHGLPSPFWLILHIYLSLRNVFQDYFSDIEKANICKLSVFFISTKQMNRVHPLSVLQLHFCHFRKAADQPKAMGAFPMHQTRKKTKEDLDEEKKR
ncbi:uncharacterized protein LOC122014601 isoform X2 [Zingiber officinale]|uniref:uncharacterized protein LOC122014601 isoform X2 n=1 Tax=Zingiber officinale TaxID=94328 RepID=UPI001C4D6542|nr:uncharacterized protein LOC122014601 isoform X2 [Zingiber officinale]